VKIPARVNLLLAVHERRVERASAVLQHCNEQLRRAESERAEQYERLLDTQARRQRELSQQGDAISGGSGRVVSATELVAARNRLAWWSARLQEQNEALAAAEATLLKSEADAAQARLRYQEVQARRSGLVRLVDERQRALARDRERIEECDSDGRWTVSVG
jgi:hypothetical protein